MLKSFYSKFWYVLGLIILSLSFPVSANTINNIRVWSSPHDTRVVMDMESEPNYTYFTLSNPDRWVFDLHNTRLIGSLPSSIEDSLIIKKIRNSRSPKPTTHRLVFELKKPHQPRIFKLPPTDDGLYGHRLVIDFEYDEADLAKQSSNTQSGSSSTTTVKPSRVPTEFVVAIDPGHGGEDPGSIGPTKKYEKHINLSISKKVAERLNRIPNMRAVLTRTGDYFVNLNKRSEIARKNKALLLVSIHADSFTTPKPRGASVFVLSTRRANTEIARWIEKQEVQSELLGGGGELLANNKYGKTVSQTVLDLQFSHSQTEGNKLALHMLDKLKGVTKIHNSKPIYASLAVLKSPDIPSILVETGFISNPQEEKLLVQNAHQNKIANAIAQAITQYFKENPPEGVVKVTNNTANVTGGNKGGKASSPVVLTSEKVITHVVESGDYLHKIADKYSLSVEEIRRQNQLTSDLLRVGQKLTLTVQVERKMMEYKVKSGDFLGKIAEEYKLTVAQLREINQLTSDRLSIGQILWVPQ